MSLSIQRISMMLLASALVLSLSACASRPVDPDSRMGRAGEKLGQAGHKIGEVSSDLWVKTKHVFRMDGTDAYHGPNADQPGSVARNTAQKTPVEMPAEFKDEVDLALIQDDFDTGPGSNEDITLTAIGDQNAELIERNAPDENAEFLVDAEQDETSDTLTGIEFVTIEPPSDEAATVVLLGEKPVTEELIVDDLPADTVSIATGDPGPDARSLVVADLDYEVQANENLWDISKRLTGDATNWEQLAALNSLDKNGTVYGGQKLQIPGDMLKPGQEQPTLAAAQPAIPQADKAPALADSVTQRLEVPTATAVEAVSEIVVAEAEAPATPAGPSTSFQVQAGESMWDLAKRTTGDATNWKAIAAVNGMSPEEAALIKYGQSLEIPDDLLKDASEIADPAVAAAVTDDVAEDEAEIAVAEAKSAEEAVPAATVVAKNEAESTIETESADESLTIVPANFKPEPTVINAAGNEPEAAPAESEDWIMVSGTYYPKAIYNDANFSATLLTRVSPGTKLQVSRAIGPWFEVKTDRGMGYVHSRDIK